MEDFIPFIFFVSIIADISSFLVGKSFLPTPSALEVLHNDYFFNHYIYIDPLKNDYFFKGH